MVKTFSLAYKSCFDEWLLGALRDAGFSGVDLSYDDDFFGGDGYEKNADKLAEFLAKFGFKCTQVHLPVYDIFESSEVVNEKNRKIN